jgi:hypothetical protein
MCMTWRDMELSARPPTEGKTAMRNGLKNRTAARILVVLAAAGLFAGGVAATASAAETPQWDDCMKVPGGWLCP